MKLLGYAVLTGIVIACSSGSTPSSTEVDSNSTPVVLESPSELASFIAIFNVATGNKTIIHDGLGSWNTWFETSGEIVNALVTQSDARPRTVRTNLQGVVISDSSTELQVRVNSTGNARAYGGLSIDGLSFQTYLEVDGVIVDLEGSASTLPLGFSPKGNRLLSYTGIPAPAGEIHIRYDVHDLDGTVRATFVSRYSAADPGTNLATWSPSGNYIATIDLDGVTLHNVPGPDSLNIPNNASNEWSPTEDALLMMTSDNVLKILRLPNLETNSITTMAMTSSAQFDPSGRTVTINDSVENITTVFDSSSGELLAEWEGIAERISIAGFAPVIMTSTGLAAIIESSPHCNGFLLIHPRHANDVCVNGQNPRWAPDAEAIAFTKDGNLIILEMASLNQRILMSDLPTAFGGTLARWNKTGTHLLVEWPWGGETWTDSLP